MPSSALRVYVQREAYSAAKVQLNMLTYFLKIIRKYWMSSINIVALF